MLKRLSILGAVLVTSGWFWYVLKPWIDSSVSLGYQGWAWPIATFILFLTVYGVALFLLQERTYAFAAILVATLPFIVLFGFHWVLLGTVVLMILMHATAYQRIKDDYSNAVRVRPHSSIGRGLPLLVTAILILISSTYYLSPSVQDISNQKKLPPRVAQVIEEVTNRILNSQFSGISFKERDQIQAQIGREVESTVNTFIGPYRQYAPIFLAVGLFVILQSFGFVAVWVASLLASGIFWLLLQISFVSIQEHDIKAQQVVL